MSSKLKAKDIRAQARVYLAENPKCKGPEAGASPWLSVPALLFICCVTWTSDYFFLIVTSAQWKGSAGHLIHKRRSINICQMLMKELQF